ncbi:MAG: ribbon-helix-helix domain-containing protein [Symploca sp. SIO2G7]|nr:ribbon-helix-helix domain-containing protein [Symploca sp. SIO2G7]
MPKSLVAGRIPSAWAAELKQIGTETGKNQSELVAEAIALYLEKTDPTSVAAMSRRLNRLEKQFKKLVELV